ncbi:MAG: hypothetical protein WBM40_01835 [Thiohalocapsa sp.]
MPIDLKLALGYAGLSRPQVRRLQPARRRDTLPMNLKLPRAYKLILSLALIAGPFTWLMFTEDGQRRSDLFILHVLGAPGFNIAYDRLNSTVTEADINGQFPKVVFQCSDQVTPFGSRICAAEIASFNGLPARQATLFYDQGTLQALQLDYRARYHDILVTSLRTGLGAPLTPVGEGVLLWRLDDGVVMLAAKQPENEADAALLWLTPALAAMRQ